MRCSRVFCRFLVVLFCCPCAMGRLGSDANAQSWKIPTGYNQLQNELGSGLEMGDEVDAMFVEAQNVQNNYMPNVASGQFLGKTFVYASGPSGESSHSNSVGLRYYSNNWSLAPNLGNDPNHPVTGFTANDWLNFEMGFATGFDPVFQPYHVSSHSYIGQLSDTFTEAMAVNLLQRLDYAINQSEMTTCVGTNNGASNTLPAILVHGYNSITVGVTDGSHASSMTGPTYLYGTGRIKPEIVAPDSFTSFSTPLVASSACLLHEAGAGTDAVRAEPLKAILLAGATKDEFADWSRTPVQPLDIQFGAGELNIYNSYHMIKAVETDGDVADPVSAAPNRGWDYEPAIGNGQERFYEFVVPADKAFTELSIVLAWNIEITDQNASPQVFDPLASLADMNLAFYDSTAGFQHQMIDSSVSAVDNVEHIYLKGLLPGTYHVRVSTDIGHDYGIAWRATEIDAPDVFADGSKLLDGIVTGGQLSDVNASDDVYLELDPNPTTNPVKQKIDMIIVGETLIQSPAVFGLCIEAKMTGGPEGDVIQTVEFWNNDTYTWEVVDTRPASNSDTLAKVSPGGDLQRFVHQPTGEIIAKVKWESQEFSGAPFFWSIDLDQMVWKIGD